MVKVIIALFLSSLALQPTGVLAALNATVDTASVGPGEPVQLSVTTDREHSGKPDFSALTKDFDVLDTSQSQNISIINGSVSRRTAWNLTLMPRNKGKLTIPAIVLDGEKTAPVTINVSNVRNAPTSQAGQGIFLETEWDKPDAIVGEQRILTVRLYRAINTNSASLTEPESDQATIRKLAKDRVYELQKNGRRYKVNEQRYAVFPQSPGELEIKPVQFQGRIPTSSHRRSPFSMFDDFGIDMDSFMGGGKPVRIWSPSIKLKVSGMPAGADPDKWLPARDVQLIQRWEPASPDFKAGEPVTRVISMLVDGQPVDQLADIKLSMPAGIKHYPDKPVENEQVTENGIISTREFKDVLVPEKAGTFHLPPVSVRWWDTGSGKYRTTSVEEQSITVKDSATADSRSMPIREPAPLPAEAERPREPDTSSIQGSIQHERSGPARSSSHIWPWVTLLFALLWLGTLLVLWKCERTGDPGEAAPGLEPKTNEKQRYKELIAALDGTDAAAIEAALIHWVGSRHADRVVTSLGHVNSLLDGKTDEDLIREIQRLERFRYQGEGQGPFDARSLKPLLARWRDRQVRQKKTSKPESGLKPLYKNV